MNHPMLTAIAGTKTVNSYGTRQRILVRSIQHFSRGSQLPPSTPWSIFLENKCLRSSASLWCHSGGTFRQLSVFHKDCYHVPLCHKHHANLFPFYIGRLPSLKQPKLLPARRLQPRCSGMFFRWAGIQRPNSQKNSQYVQTESKSWKRTTVLSVFMVTE